MLQIENSLLVIVDVQERLVPFVQNREMLVTNIIKIIECAKILDVPFVFTEQLPEKVGYTDVRVRTVLGDCDHFTKDTFSCCGAPGFIERIESLDRKQILIAGIEAHVCVFQTSFDLLRNGYQVHVLSDAVSSRTQLNFDMVIKRGGQGTIVVDRSVEPTPDCKAISQQGIRT